MKGTIIQFEKHTQPKGEITMKNKISKVLKNEKGLTLIELLAVIVILAIISAIAIPAIGNIIENSRYNAVKADAINVINAANLYYTDNPQGETAVGGSTGASTTSVSVKQLIDTKYLENSGKIPADATVTLASPRALTTTTANVIKYSGTKEVKFTSATIELINNNAIKGSVDGNKVIPAP